MNVIQAPAFEKRVKKLHKNAKQSLDDAVREVLNDPLLGELKKGDLSFVRIYKFTMVKQLTLLAYIATNTSLILLYFGPHENFYRELKKSSRLHSFACT